VLKRIHVNQHIIKRNKSFGQDEPPLTVKTYNANYTARTVDIDGPSRVVYSPDKPLSCGARVWIETNSPVSLDTGETIC
jgi:hypothetical protein